MFIQLVAAYMTWGEKRNNYEFQHSILTVLGNIIHIIVLSKKWNKKSCLNFSFYFYFNVSLSVLFLSPFFLCVVLLFIKVFRKTLIFIYIIYRNMEFFLLCSVYITFLITQQLPSGNFFFFDCDLFSLELCYF